MRALAALLVLLSVQPAQPPVREIAVTFDDLPVATVIDRDAATWSTVTNTLLDSLRRHHVPAIGFVNEQKLERSGGADPARVELLRRWLAAGLELGNHTYSHLDLHSADLELFERDVLRGEGRLRPMLQEAGRPLRYFRHPYLHTGRTLETRRAFEKFLAEHDYRVAPVSIDNYDYVFAAAYERTGDAATRQKVVDEYITYMASVVAYYEQQSIAIVGREIRQILLVHASALNAAAFDRLVEMLKARGYAFVTLDRALEDDAYTLRDTYTGPAGVTWLHRWALSQGKRGAIFASEPRVPEWIEQAALPSRG